MTDRKYTEGLSKKDRYWLEMAGYGANSGGYPGERWEENPRRFAALEQRGLVRLFIPQNPAHKERAVITDAGRAALSDRSE